MTTSPSQRIGLVTCGAEKLADYFPTAAEPDFVPTEPPFTPDDQLLVLPACQSYPHRLPIPTGRMPIPL